MQSYARITLAGTNCAIRFQQIYINTQMMMMMTVWFSVPLDDFDDG